MRTIGTIACASGMVFLLLLGSMPVWALEPPVRILPLGDSITYGVTDTTTQGGYRNRLYSNLTTAGFNVDFTGTLHDSNNPSLPDRDHEGWPGFLSDQLDANIENWLSEIEDPDVVLLMIGTNDVWQTYLNPSGYPLSLVEANFSNLIAHIATLRPFARIIVTKIPRTNFDPAFENQVLAFNADVPGIVAQHVALGRQVSWVDMHSAITASDLTSDGVHPKTAGYNKIADAWMPAITAVIAPKGTANPPMIADVEALVDSTHVTVLFSKPVADNAAALANFALSDGVTISSASLDSATKRTVTLTTSPLVAGTRYTLTASGVRDRTPQQNLIASESKAYLYPNALTNGSFENGYTGWSTFTGDQLVFVAPGDPGDPPYAATDGISLVVFNGGDDPPNGVLSQTVATTAGRSYELTFDLGTMSWNTHQQTMQVKIQGSGTLLQTNTSLSGLGGAASLDWQPRNYTFTANSNSTTITFTDVSSNVGGNSTGIDMLLDNVAVKALPHPALAVTSTPVSGASMTVSAADLDGSGNGSTGLIRSYAQGASVTITAPASYGGGNFLRWQKNGANLSGSSRTLNLTMTANTAINAVYDNNATVVANPDAYSTNQDLPLTVSAPGVLANDTNSSAQTMTAVLDSPPAHGVVTLSSNGGFTYSPASGFFGADTFNYHAVAGSVQSATAVVTLTVNRANTAPVAVNDSYSISKNSPLVVPAAGVLANDTDAQANPLTAALDAGPVHGTLALNSNGGFTYTPAAGYTGPDSFTYHANDGSLNSNVATVGISVQEIALGALVNGSFESGLTGWTYSGNLDTEAEAPYSATNGSTLIAFNGGQAPPNGVLAQSFATAPGQTYTLSFDAGALAYNKRQQKLQVTITGTGSLLNQTITLTGLGKGAILWAPQSFVFVADGSSAALTFRDVSTITDSIDLLLDNVRIAAPINTAPVAVSDSYTASLNTALVVAAAGVLANDTDAQSNALTAVLDAGPAHGSLALNANGGFTYTPATGYSGPDSFTYHASDGSLNSNAATVSITIQGVVQGTLVNGSFESGFTGWTYSGNLDTEAEAPYYATDGTTLVAFNGGQSTPNAVLSQTIATTPGQTCTLSFDAGVLAYNKNQQKLQVTVTGSGSLLNQTITLAGLGKGAIRWTPQSFAFVADGNSANLTFRDISTVTDSIDLLLDHVQIVPQAVANTLALAALPSAEAAAVIEPAAFPGAPDIPTPQLSGSPGAITLHIEAASSGSYVLESSEDLVHWQVDDEKTVIAPGPVEFQDTQVPSSSREP